MISFIRGIVREILDDALVVEYHGLGFQVSVPSSLCQQVKDGDEITLYTHLMIREVDVNLYGFSDPSERRLFLSLLDVSGIGPKQSLRLLSEMSAVELRTAILQGDSARLSRVKGIGAKTASRIILELQDKMKRLSLEMKETEGTSSQRLELLMAMRVLGYTDQEASRAIDILWKDEQNRKLSLEDQVKQLLLLLSRR